MTPRNKRLDDLCERCPLQGYTLTYDAATGKFRLNAAGTLILLR